MIITQSILLAGLLAASPSAAVQDDTVGPALQRALDTISADEIRADLEFIASDEMAGRDSPSKELRIAARFIRNRVKRLGLQPGAPDERFLYEWQIYQPKIDRSKCGLTIHTGPKTSIGPLALGQDYFFGSFTSRGMRELSGPIVFAGDLDKDVFESLDYVGKWVLTTTGIRGKRLRTLSAGGALGLIVLPPEDAKKTVAERLGRNDRAMDNAGITFRDPGDKAGPGFPVLHLTEAAAARLPAAALAEVEPGDLMEWTADERCHYDAANRITLENVVAVWPGSDPELKDEVIILSAHYDHVGVLSDGRINNGADDNGSGTTGMLALAEALTAYGPMRRSVMLMWVSAEEKGLLGSQAWTKDPYLPGGLKPLCNINIDMIGRNAPDELLITPTSRHKAYSALTQVAEANAASEGFTKIKSADAYYGRSDQINFERNMGLPVAFLFCDVHEDYHKPTDTPDKIDYDKMRRICRLVMRMLEALQIDDPTF